MLYTRLPALSPLASNEICPVTPVYWIDCTWARTSSRVGALPEARTFLMAVISIIAGAVVLRTALDLSGASEAVLCETALREGIVADYVATNRPGILLVDEFPDLLASKV